MPEQRCRHRLSTLWTSGNLDPGIRMPESESMNPTPGLLTGGGPLDLVCPLSDFAQWCAIFEASKGANSTEVSLQRQGTEEVVESGSQSPVRDPNRGQMPLVGP